MLRDASLGTSVNFDSQRHRFSMMKHYVEYGPYILKDLI